MPPIRTITPVKPTKTERSHEENQERAYIAASRRSDRSLEARVESARRASEIHKRRTGRSLRVTEQDVINEEMYEEEDDDIPAQYRRLTAHMNSGSTDFNRRLTAYLSNHVAMRHALGQALSSSYQQFPNGTPWAQSMNAMLSPSGNQISLQPQPSEASPMVFPALYNSAPPFRQSPYPLPPSHSSRQQVDQNQSPSSPASATPTPGTGTADTSLSARSKAARRASEPLHPKLEEDQGIPTKELGKSASASPFVAQAPTSGNTNSETSNDNNSEDLPSSNPQYPPTPNSFANPLAFQNTTKNEPYSLGPFSTALPPEARMFSGAFDPNDPFGYRMWNDPKNHTFQSKLEGMNQTLAPSAFDDMSGGASWTEGGDQTDLSVPFSAPSFMYNFDNTMDDTVAKGGLVDGGIEADGDWASLIDQSSFEEGPN